MHANCSNKSLNHALHSATLSVDTARASQLAAVAALPNVLVEGAVIVKQSIEHLKLLFGLILHRQSTLSVLHNSLGVIVHIHFTHGMRFKHYNFLIAACKCFIPLHNILFHDPTRSRGVAILFKWGKGFSLLLLLYRGREYISITLFNTYLQITFPCFCFN